MRSPLLACICILLCASAFAATPEEEAVKYRADIDEGVSLLRTGSRDEIHRSIAKFKSALKARPDEIGQKAQGLFQAAQNVGGHDQAHLAA